MKVTALNSGMRSLQTGMKLTPTSRRLSVRVAAESKRRVVVTGMGVVTCLGHEVDEFYNALLEGKNGVTKIEGFDPSDLSTRIAGEIKSLDATAYMNKKLERRFDKCMKYTLVSGKKAMADAGLSWNADAEDVDRSRCGIIIGSAFGGLSTFSSSVEALNTAGYRKMNPFCVPSSIVNMPGAMLAVEVGYMGPTYSLNTACATGNYCTVVAAQHIQRGEADVMLAGAADAIVIPIGIAGFIACKALSRRNDDPATASRPWDRDRDGFVMGEGAGVLVLEEYEHAKARGARIYAEYLGGAFSCDAHHMTEPQPDGKGVIMAIHQALSNSNVTPERVTYVNAHATSTQAGDMAEYNAIRSVFSSPSLRMNSTKSMIGHLMGASGAVEAVATVKALQTGWVHPTINLKNPEEGVDLNVVLANGKEHLPHMDVALTNSFGFGGHNSCVLFGKAPAA